VLRSIVDFFRSGDEPTPSQILKATRQVTQPHGDPAVRMAAAERLRRWGTPESIAALLRRFTIQTPSGAVDIEESQEVESMLVELGPAAVEPILAFLGHEPRGAYAARALQQILPAEEYVSRMLGVLGRLDSGFGSSGEQRAGLIRALEDIDDPRVAAGVRPFLDDPDDDVVVAALGCIARSGDPAWRDDLVRLLLSTGDRPRLREATAERLVELGWSLGDGRREVATQLPAGFAVDKKGRVVRVG
jgi:HEAT repeat protein